ncbi:MAG: cytochrome c [Methyloprofundus sp.]|nr:cytochrome c [Methyloprofundus sp.]
MRKMIGLLVCSSIALISTAQAEGDIENGRALSTQCSACHGTYGLSSSEQFPNIAGQKEAYLVSQLLKYKSGEITDPLMSAIVGPLGNDDINDLAAYFSANETVASYSGEEGVLRIPFVNVGDATYDVEMSLDSFEDLIFSVSHLEER